MVRQVKSMRGTEGVASEGGVETQETVEEAQDAVRRDVAA